jgi:hypothetical protein
MSTAKPKKMPRPTILECRTKWDLVMNRTTVLENHESIKAMQFRYHIKMILMHSL